MMKIFKWVIISIMVFAVFAVFLFPYEACLKNLCAKLQKEKNIRVSWEKGSFLFLQARLENVRIQSAGNAGALGLQYDKITVTPFLTGLKIRALKNNIESAVSLTTNKVDFDIKELPLPDVLNSGKGALTLKGYYYQKDKIGEGNFTSIVNNLILKDYAGRAEFNGTCSLRAGKLELAFTVSGDQISGSGEAYVSVSKFIESSSVNGSAYLYYGNIGKKFKITGTLKNITLTE